MQSKVTFFATKWRIALLGIAILVSACDPIGQSDSCAGWKPIILAAESIDGLTDQDAQEVLAHNVYGRERDCW